jgi:iron complex transport system substrate-binding protein
VSARKLSLLALATSVLGIFVYFALQRPAPVSKPKPDASRIVSLSPGITETLFAIGAGSKVIGVTDFCMHPPEVLALPRFGTTMTPNYEAIARSDPTLIVAENAAEARRSELSALADTLFLPWLTLRDLTTSIRKLGERVDHSSQAKQLASELERRLGVPEPKTGPRVLLAIGHTPGKLDEIWFMRNNSVHGAALRAAGGRNAVAEDIPGLPRIALARLVELDPDIILILAKPTKPRIAPALYVDDYVRLAPLQAVRQQRIAVIDTPDALVNGPRILELLDRLKLEIKRLQTP